MTASSTGSMDRFTTDGATIEYATRGAGEPLLLIHGAMIADAWTPIVDRLADQYRVMWYHRRGFRGSSPARDENTIAAEASDAAALLDHLDIEKAHVAGHSYGGVTSLQFALDHSRRAHSLGLLEPALLTVPAGADFGEGVQAIGRIFESGDAEGALNAFLHAVGGDDPIGRLNKVLDEGWYEAALEDLPTLFTGDLVALGGWQCDAGQLGSIAQPALVVVGTDSAALFTQSHEVLMQHLPAGEPFKLAGATHMLQMDNPGDMAAGLLGFLASHPMG